MKKYLSILLLSFACHALLAQSGDHTWQMGPLSWNDFSVREGKFDKHSYLEYYLLIDKQTVVISGVKCSYPFLSAYTNYQHNWVEDGYQNDDVLTYNQCIFDIVESWRRRLSPQVLSIDPWQYPQFLVKSTTTINQDIARFEEATMHGANIAELNRMSALFKAQLDTIPLFKPTSFELAGLAFGGVVGGGIKSFAAPFGQYFSPARGLYANIDLIANRHYFTLGSYLGWAMCRQNLYGSDDYVLIHTDAPSNLIDLYLGYGYTLFSNSRHTFTPFVGVGIDNYKVFENSETFGTRAISYRAGLDYNLLLSRRVSSGSWELNQSRYNASYRQLMLNLKAFASYSDHGDLADGPQGVSFNLQLGFGFRTCNALYR